MGSFSAGTTEAFGTVSETSGLRAAAADFSNQRRREAITSNTTEQVEEPKGRWNPLSQSVHDRTTAKTECQNYYDHPDHHWSKDPPTEQNEHDSYMGGEGVEIWHAKEPIELPRKYVSPSKSTRAEENWYNKDGLREP